jgi:outer membrane beta-barrel protein
MQKTILTIFLILFGASNVWAQKEKESDKLDIKKLEDKYWAAKDDDFSVVQNRAFTKANRFFVSALGGFPINDPYSNGSSTYLSLGYHTSERWGYELSYMKADLRDNDATEQFIKDHKTVPNHNTLVSTTTAQVNFIPLYAKMSFMDKKIIYFDMGIALGLGQTAFTQNIVTGDKSGTATHYMFSLYQHFFFSEHFAFKFDFRNTWTDEERFRYKMNSGEPESNRTLGTKSINDTSLMFGLTFFL